MSPSVCLSLPYPVFPVIPLVPPPVCLSAPHPVFPAGYLSAPPSVSPLLSPPVFPVVSSPSLPPHGGPPVRAAHASNSGSPNKRGVGAYSNRAMLHGQPFAFEKRDGLAERLVGADLLRGEEQPVGIGVAYVQGGVERQRMKGRRDQRRGVVVERGIEVADRPCRVLEGRGTQFGARLPGECGQVHGIEVDQVQPPRGIHDDIFGFEVSVCPVVRRKPCGQAVERRGQLPQPCCVFCRGRLCVERRAFDPVAQYDVDPNPAPGRVVEVQLLRQQPFAVNLRQVARRMHVAPQRADMPFVADTEDDGAVAYGVAHAAPAVTAYLHAAQGFRQSVGVGQCREVLSQREHGLLVVLLPGLEPKIPVCRVGRRKRSRLPAWAKVPCCLRRLWNPRLSPPVPAGREKYRCRPPWQVGPGPHNTVIRYPGLKKRGFPVPLRVR